MGTDAICVLFTVVLPVSTHIVDTQEVFIACSIYYLSKSHSSESY